MPSFVHLLIGILFLSSCNSTDKNHESKAQAYVANKAVVLKIEGMTNSNSCPKKIQEGLICVPGIVSAEIDFAGQLAKISFDSLLVQVPTILQKISTIEQGQYGGKIIQTRAKSPSKIEEEEIIITTPKSKEELEESNNEISV
jgi:copper chaperone CopZ